MDKYRFWTLTIIFIFIGGSSYQFVHHRLSDETAKELKARPIVHPYSEEFSKKDGSIPHYKAYRKNSRTSQKDLVGVAFSSLDITPKIRGYAGPIKIMVGLDTKGVITGVHVISHSETPAYVIGLAPFIKQFYARSITKPLELDKDIDGISRATMTSEAIIQSINQGGARVGERILSLSIDRQPAPKNPFRYDVVIITCLLFTVAVLGVIKKSDKLRWLSLTGGLIYFGLIHSTMVSVVQFINIGLIKIPTFVDHPLWYCLVGLTLITLFLLGNVYCGSLCPFATLQEIIYNLAAGIRPKKWHVNQRMENAARQVKYIILCGVVALALLMGKSDPANIEVFVLLFSRHASTLGWCAIILMLVAGAFHFRFWCRYFCPVGALNGLLARYSLYKIGLDQGCGGCEACVKLCPTDAIHMKNDRPIINFAECILCGKCMTRCPKGSLHLEHLQKSQEPNHVKT